MQKLIDFIGLGSQIMRCGPCLQVPNPILHMSLGTYASSSFSNRQPLRQLTLKPMRPPLSAFVLLSGKFVVQYQEGEGLTVGLAASITLVEN